MTRKELKFHHKPWITPGLQVSIIEKERLHKKYIKYQTEENEIAYKAHDKLLRKLKFQAEKNFFTRKIDRNIHNKKKTWDIFSEITTGNPKSKCKPQVKELIDKENNSVIKDSKDIANRLNTFFNTVGTNMASKIPNTQKNPLRFMRNIPVNSIFLNPTTAQEICEIIASLRNGKAAGADSISVYLIKQFKEVISPVLSDLFNKCLLEGLYPDIFKIAKIIPLHKGGDPRDETNYRPISLISILGKVLEKVIYKRFVKFFDDKNILSKHQFGFRKSFSTGLAVAEIYEKLLSNLDQNKSTCAIFLDLAKAFDTVDHKILLSKLEKSGIRGVALEMMKSYLSNRKQFVQLGTSSSLYKVMSIGVPQGSVLGPLLFLIFINDLPNATNLDIKLFADDTFLSASSSNKKTLQKLIDVELKKVYTWLVENKLTLNIKKSQFMIITNKKNFNKDDFKVKLNGKNLNRCTSYKYLGVMLDDKLNWKVHIDYIIAKISRVCGVLSKLRHFVRLDTIKTVYYALAYSHLQYCILSWGNADYTILDPLRRLQNKIMRIISFTPLYGPLDVYEMYEKLDMLQIDKVHQLEKAKFMFKYNKKMLPDAFNNYFLSFDEAHTYNTRSSSRGDYQKINIRTGAGQKMLRYNGASLWNQLPTELRNLHSVAMFTKACKEHLKHSDSGIN